MTTCLRQSYSFGLLCVSHRRRKVLNIGSGGGGGGERSKVQNTGEGGGGNFSLAVNGPEPPPPISAKQLHFSHLKLII